MMVQLPWQNNKDVTLKPTREGEEVTEAVAYHSIPSVNK
jgi:hypothetical protein